MTQSPNPTWVGIAAGLPCCFEAKRVLGFFRVSQSDQAGLLGALGTAPGFLSAVYCYIIYFDLLLVTLDMIRFMIHYFDYYFF